MSDVDRAMAMAVAAANLEDSQDGNGSPSGDRVKGPTGPPRRSLGRPKVSVLYVLWSFSTFFV